MQNLISTNIYIICTTKRSDIIWRGSLQKHRADCTLSLSIQNIFGPFDDCLLICPVYIYLFRPIFWWIYWFLHLHPSNDLCYFCAMFYVDVKPLDNLEKLKFMWAMLKNVYINDKLWYLWKHMNIVSDWNCYYYVMISWLCLIVFFEGCGKNVPRLVVMLWSVCVSTKYMS